MGQNQSDWSHKWNMSEILLEIFGFIIEIEAFVVSSVWDIVKYYLNSRFFLLDYIAKQIAKSKYFLLH